AGVAFNWWQERQLRNEAARHVETPDSDVLMDEEFQFDPEAILPEESQDLSKLAADDFDALSFDEKRRPADAQQDAVLNEQTYEEFEAAVGMAARSEERRVGKECRARRAEWRRRREEKMRA